MKPRKEQVWERHLWKAFLVGDGCWLWTKGKTSKGYGAIYWHDGQHLGHRAVYEWLVGPIPEGLQLDHLCRNRACVRPDHLEPVTRRENIRRGVAPSGLNARKTHCPQEHPYDEKNTWVSVAGRRQCRTCHRASVAAAKRALKMAEVG